jgi:hypothetical protein
VQVRLARDGLDAADAPALVRRQDRLISEYGARWARALGFRARRWRFRRGFVDEVSIGTEDDLQAELFGSEAVRVVRIASVDQPKRLAENALLGELRALAIEGGQIMSVLESPHFAVSELEIPLANATLLEVPPSVRRLVLTGRYVTARELAAIARAPWVRALELSTGNLRLDDEILARLDTLDLWSADLASARSLFASPAFRPRRLALHGLNGDAIARELARWPGLDGLEELSLSRTGLSDASPLHALGHASGDVSGARLRRLDVAGNELDVGRLHALAASPMARWLNVLAIGGMRSFAALSGAPLDRLVVLDAEGTPYERIGELEGRPRLARVTYSRDPASADPSDRAPL